MRYIALLRGVMPSGRNSIPSMAALADGLTDAGFRRVRTFLQSGNLLLETPLSEGEAAAAIRRTVLERTGADLAVILKRPEQLSAAAGGNPFGEGFDQSRVHLVFTNGQAAGAVALEHEAFDGEAFAAGEECFYLYLPRDAARKRLNTNYLEKRLGITATMRKLSVVRRLSALAAEGGQGEL